MQLAPVLATPPRNLSAISPGPKDFAMASPSTTSTLGPRRHDLDNLRSFLTCLVVLHHTAIAYGGAGVWGFQSAIFPPQNQLLIVFNAVNQSFFMALFFYISGRMSAQSLTRHSLGEFIRSKTLRLGLPAVVYTLLITPLTGILLPENWEPDKRQNGLARYYMRIRGVTGPVWYTATLLAMDLVTAGVLAWWRSGRVRLPVDDDEEDNGARKARWLNHHAMCRYGWLAVAVASFFVRLWYPVGTVTWVISVQAAYLPQYIYAYTLGHLSFEQGEPRLTNPLEPATSPTPVAAVDPESAESAAQPTQPSGPPRIPTLSLYPSLALMIGIMPLIFIFVFANGLPKRPEEIGDVTGGWSSVAATYAVWNELGFILIGPALMAHFQKWYARPATSRIWKARYSYAAFLLHVLVSFSVEVVVEWAWMAIFGKGRQGAKSSVEAVWKTVGPVLITAAVGGVNCVLSFIVGGWLVRVPGIKKII